MVGLDDALQTRSRSRSENVGNDAPYSASELMRIAEPKDPRAGEGRMDARPVGGTDSAGAMGRRTLPVDAAAGYVAVVPSGASSAQASGEGGTTDREVLAAMTTLDKYIAGWRAHDPDAILESLTPDCVVIESFGPVYRGHAWVERWVDKWISERGRVIDWNVRHLCSLRDTEMAEWTFHYSLRDEERIFDGATIAKLDGGRISYLREYATSAPLYDWRGEWKSI